MGHRQSSQSGLPAEITNPLLSSEHGIHGEHQNLPPEHGTHEEHQNPSGQTPPLALPHSSDQTPPTPTDDVHQITAEEQPSGQTPAPPAPPLPTTVMVIGDANIVRFINGRSSSTALDLEMGGGQSEVRNRLHRWLGERDLELEVLHTSGRRETEADPIPQPTTNVTSTSNRFLQFLNRYYQYWEHFTTVVAIGLTFLTPFEFGFLFPTTITWPVMVVDGAICLIGSLDYILEWYLWRKGIIHRTYDYYWVLSTFDGIGSLPWVVFYMASRYEYLKPFIMLRIFRVRKAYDLLQKLKSWASPHYIRSILVLFLEIFCVNVFWAHVEGCFAFYLATVWPESNTWIGCLDKNQRNEYVGKYYIPSLYFLMVTIATIGYGDFHAVNELEMGFVITAATFNLCLTFYISAQFSSLLQTMERFSRNRA